VTYFRDEYHSREEVRSVPCPACGAAPGENCVAARGKVRLSNHMERVYAYKATRA